jgi:hypothetical protein
LEFGVEIADFNGVTKKFSLLNFHLSKDLKEMRMSVDVLSTNT